jgi:hypothetical protein
MGRGAFFGILFFQKKSRSPRILKNNWSLSEIDETLKLLNKSKNPKT